MKKIIAFLLLCTVFACKDEYKDGQNELAGRWKMVSSCRSTDNSACNNIVIPTGKNVFIEFSNKGQFNEYYKGTIPAEYAFLGCGIGSYELEDGDVRIRAMCMSSLQGMLIQIRSVSENRLVLSYSDNNEFVFERYSGNI